MSIDEKRHEIRVCLESIHKIRVWMIRDLIVHLVIRKSPLECVKPVLPIRKHRKDAAKTSPGFLRVGSLCNVNHQRDERLQYTLSWTVLGHHSSAVFSSDADFQKEASQSRTEAMEDSMALPLLVAEAFLAAV